MNANITLILISFLAFVIATSACRCTQPALPDSYYKQSTKRFVKAIALQTFIQEGNRFYLLEIQRDYKACPDLPKFVLTATELDRCGPVFELNTPYALSLNSTGFFVNVNRCQVCTSISYFFLYQLFEFLDSNSM